MKKLGSKIFLLLGITLIVISCCKVDEPCVENIEEDCACIMIYQPVCGCNGKTYSNGCVAQCSGITDFTEGACE